MRSKKRKIVNYNRYFYFFITPFMLVFLTFSLYPLIYTFVLSFSDTRGFSLAFNFAGLQNYERLLGDPSFLITLTNVVRIWVFNFIPQLVVAIFLAAMFCDIRLKLRGVGFYKIVIFMPYILTAVSVGMLFQMLFAFPNGFVNQLLIDVGLIDESFHFFLNTTASSLIVSFIQFWLFVGYTIVLFVAGVKGIPETLYEAAIVDGARVLARFRHITLPLMKPIILYFMIMTIVGGLQIFEIPLMIGGVVGSPDGVLRTMVMYIYNTAFRGANDWSYAATLSIALFAIIVLLSIVVFRLLSPREKGGVSLEE